MIVLYAEFVSGDVGEFVVDDFCIWIVVCGFGYDVVGYWVYVRVVGGFWVEVFVGLLGGRFDEYVFCWGIDLVNGIV